MTEIKGADDETLASGHGGRRRDVSNQDVTAKLQKILDSFTPTSMI